MGPQSIAPHRAVVANGEPVTLRVPAHAPVFPGTQEPRLVAHVSPGCFQETLVPPRANNARRGRSQTAADKHFAMVHRVSPVPTTASDKRVQRCVKVSFARAGSTGRRASPQPLSPDALNVGLVSLRRKVDKRTAVALLAPLVSLAPRVNTHMFAASAFQERTQAPWWDRSSATATRVRRGLSGLPGKSIGRQQHAHVVFQDGINNTRARSSVMAWLAAKASMA